MLAASQQNVAVTQVTRHSAAIEAAVDSEWLPFSGKLAREKSALLLIAVADHESGMRAAIEYCSFDSLPGMTQDHGRSVGLAQAFQGPAWFGHTRAQICGNAELQFKLALRYLTYGMRRCGSVGGALSAYNQNVCRPTIYSARVSHAFARLSRQFL